MAANGLSRRAALRSLLGRAAGLSALSVLAACQPAAPSPTPATPPPAAAPTADNPLIKPRATGADLTAVRASSELAVGRNRFVLGLLDAGNQPVTSGSLTIEFLKLGPSGADKRAEAPATFRTIGGGAKGVWVANVAFPETGQWRAQVTLDQPPDPPRQARFNFEVIERFSAPGYGDPAPRSASVTVNDVGGDPTHVCTNVPPCPLHDLSIAEALADGQKPLVVAFATPALCTSATCGPELDAVLQLHAAFPNQANFVHVEIYQYPFDGSRVAPAVEEWRLPSEPWVFVVDKSGAVRDRFEGTAPLEELAPALKAALA